MKREPRPRRASNSKLARQVLMRHRSTVIPPNARQRIVERHPNGAKWKAFFYLNGQRVGWKRWDEQGHLFIECAMRQGLDHGLCRHYDDGAVSWEVPCVRGKAHGISRQYARNGNLIGTSRWSQGTGVDLWYHDDGQLYEERHIRNGLRHGVERWWWDERTVSSEYHFKQDIDHGIHREWNVKGRLRRGFPRYFIDGLRVTKRQYEHASENDPSLPKFHERDNKPSRELPRTLPRGPANKGMQPTAHRTRRG
jgi:antitoxin component YwqK of YwqJK toxin-antitoxin module